MALLADAIHFVHTHFEEDFSEQLLSLIETKQSVIDQPGIKLLVFEYAVTGASPNSEGFDEADDLDDSKIMSLDDLVQTGQRLIVRSVHGGRARAWEAVSRLLWHQEQIIDDVWMLLESRVTVDSSVGVRLQMFEAMKPLFNHDKLRYKKNLKKLILQSGVTDNNDIDPIYILATRYGVNMQKYIDYNFPELTRNLISRLLACGNEQAALIGWWWQCCEFFRHNRSRLIMKSSSEMSEQEKLLLADIAGAAFTWTEEKNFTEEILLKCFDDESEKVQGTAAEVFRSVKSEDFSDYENLAWKFIETPSFLSNSSYLLYSMEGANCNVMDLVIAAAEKLIDSVVVENDQHGGRVSGLYKVQEMLSQEYASSETSPTARTKILNLVDKMLENEIYGAEKITDVNER